MTDQQAHFLQQDLFALLQTIKPESPANWGKMNAQQMIEHLEIFFDVSYEKVIYPLTTPEEQLPKYIAFLYSDKQFRENTKAPSSILGEDTLPLVHSNIDEAMVHLKNSVSNFFDYFRQHPGKKTMHPAFGLLNEHEWIMLHYKHVTHHLRQFSLCS